MDEHFEYRTGRTDPAKSSRGLIALLLICVIILGGLVSVLSVMNIQLIWQLKGAQHTTMSFAEGEAVPEIEESLVLAGMSLQEADPVYRQLHELPEGLYVAQIEPGSPAETLQIQPGDVLISLNETPVSTLESAKTLLKARKNHSLLLWRDGREISLTISQ